MTSIRHFALIGACCAVLSLVVPASLRAADDTPGRPSLGGVWQLNRDQSSPAGSGAGGEIGPGDGRGGRGGPGGGMGGPGRGMGGRGGGMGGPGGRMGGRGGPGGGGPPDREEMQRMRDLMRELLAAPVRLTIVQRGETVTFTDDEGHVRRFVANGRDEKHQLTSGTLETVSRWKDGAMVIAWETGRGPTVVRSYRIDAGTKQLVVETTMKGARGGGDRPPLRHVYDAVESLVQD